MPDATISVFNIQKFSLHDGSGIRTAVFFSGCPLRCGWCSNPESQRMGFTFDGDGIQSAKRMGVRDILAEVRKDRPFYETSGGGMTLSGGEVLMQIDGAVALLDAARAEDIHTCAETSCFAPPDEFERLIAHVDMLLPDLKHYDEEKHIEGTGVPLAPIIENLKALARSGVPHTLRMPVIPGFNDSAKDAQGFAALIGSLGMQRVELLPFHQFGERKYELLGAYYAYRDVKALKEEQLADYAQILRDAGIAVIL